MTATGWPGEPLFPERDGDHALQWGSDDPVVCRWFARQRWWMEHGHPGEVARSGARYIGPVLTPSELATREAEARAAGIEKAARVARAAKLDTSGSVNLHSDEAYNRACEYCFIVIRALAASPPAGAPETVTVPREPTHEMVTASLHVFDGFLRDKSLAGVYAARIYAAMLAASPTQPPAVDAREAGVLWPTVRNAVERLKHAPADTEAIGVLVAFARLSLAARGVVGEG